MTASAVQFDLFAAALKGAGPADLAIALSTPPAPPVTLFERMSELARGNAESQACQVNQAGRAWAEQKIVVWSGRAAEQRALAEKGVAGAAQRAFALEWHVARLRERHGLENAPPAIDGPIAAEIERLRARLEGWQPRLDERIGCMVNAGPITAEIRRELETKIAELEGAT